MLWFTRYNILDLFFSFSFFILILKNNNQRKILYNKIHEFNNYRKSAIENYFVEYYDILNKPSSLYKTQSYYRRAKD